MRLLGISAEHVHRECVEAITDGRGAVTCQIGAATFDPRERVIDIDEELDLVTYEVSEIQVHAAKSDIHYAPSWPPSCETDGLVIAGGWVGTLTHEALGETTSSFYHVYARTENFTERQIGVAIYTSTSHPWGGTGLPVGMRLGGLSGGPVFLVREDPLTEVYLAGVIFQYQPSYEILLARPLSLIEADGLIIRG